MAERSLTIYGAGQGRAVSDVVGYVLMFGVVITTIGLVSVGGYQSLSSVREQRQLQNSQRAFELLSTNIRDITHRGAPRRTTTIKLSGDKLAYGEPVRMNVSAYPAGSPGAKHPVANVTLVPLMLEHNSRDAVVYSMGGVFVRSTGGVTLSDGPGIVLQRNRAVLPVVRTITTEQRSVIGTTTVAIRMSLFSSSVLLSNASQTTLWVNMTTDRASAWRDYFVEHTGASWRDCPAAKNDDTHVACKFSGVENVGVARYVIDVEYVS